MSSRKAQIGVKVGLGFLETVIHVCVYILVIFLFIRVATWGYDFSYHIFGDPVMSQYNKETVQFTVREGQSVQEVASALEKADLIKYDLAFRIRAKLEKLEASIAPGTYELSQSMTADEILSILSTPVESGSGSDAVLGENASGQIEEETEPESGAEESGEDTAGEE